MDRSHSEDYWDLSNQSPKDPNAYRGHLPPPFYNAKNEEVRGRRYPSEGRLSAHAPEDVGNYGRGGYYGHTYDQENVNRSRNISEDNRVGYPNSYRHLGDRRSAYPGNRSWEAERPYRAGYSHSSDRFPGPGMHQGKGPKSYRRSDGRILEDLNDRLFDDAYLNASDIETDVREGEIILSGTVESRHAKRRAEDIAEAVSGVRHVENRLRIIRSDA